MRQRRRVLGCVAAAATVLAGLAVHATADAGERGTEVRAAGRGSPASGEAGRTVTLLTGDLVVLPAGSSTGNSAGSSTDAGAETSSGSGAAGRVSVRPGPGREGVTFVVQRTRGHLEVVPGDVTDLLAAGRLDRRLFDVTTLLAYGYDDGSHAQLPLIVTAPRGGTSAKARTRVTGAGGSVVRELPGVGAVVVRQHRARATGLWHGLSTGTSKRRTLRAEVGTIALDGLRKPALNTSVAQIGAPAVWQTGLTGTGVSVAVLDSGVDATHPDLAGRVAAQRNFTEGAEDDLDRTGHGTHVAAIVAGSGAASSGTYRGVAPGASLLDGKVCAVGGCADSWIVAGMEWAAAEQHARVVNLSLGSTDTAEIDVVEQAVATLTERYGTLFVVAAGNSGTDGSIESPGSADAALTVGAVDDADAIADLSSRGPRSHDDGIKPDLTAPGVAVTSARSGGIVDAKNGGGAADRYLTASGTSMAAPHVAGAAAILAQAHPDWSPQRLKATLMASARPVQGAGVFAQGAGRVDVARAVAQVVTADPSSVGFGRQLWPHADDPVLTREVTFHNGGAERVTLALSVAATGPDGKPVPTGVFTLSAAELVVPAGGQASVSLTADTRVTAPDGLLSGHLVATPTGGTDPAGRSVSVPVAVHRETESYDVTIRQIGRDGKPRAVTGTAIDSADTSDLRVSDPDGDGTVTVRLPRGRYLVSAIINEGEGTEATKTLLVDPKLDVTAARTVVLDSRLARPLSVTVPDKSVAPAAVTVGYQWQLDNWSFATEIIAPDFHGLRTAQIGSARADDVAAVVTGYWARPSADVEWVDSPVLYRLDWLLPGGMVTGFRRNVSARDLAVVRVDYAAAASGATGETSAGAALNRFRSSWDVRFSFRLPFTRTEYYNTDGGIRWERRFREVVDGEKGADSIDVLIGSSTRYSSGPQRPETWNGAVFGPVLPDFDGDPATPGGQLVRTGDTVRVAVPLFGDGAGHEGYSGTTADSTKLYRDGVLVGEEPYSGYATFAVPAGTGRYRLAVTSGRAAPFTLSTRVDAVWTFRSGHVDGSGSAALPMWVVGFTPTLDGQGTAPAGGRFVVPVRVAPQPGAKVGRLGRVDVEVSYDDGGTWRPASVQAPIGADGGSVLVDHPAGEGHVSLRARATDSDGNTVEQTIVRAYRYA